MKNLIQKRLSTTEEATDLFMCACPYCKHDLGCIDDPGYHYERIESPECPECNKEFKVVDELRRG